MLVAGSYPFVGRERELDAIRHLLEVVRTGRLGVALVQGEAGIGKSRLVEEALRKAGPAGFEVFAGRCDEFERARAFAPLAEAFGCVGETSDPRRSSIADLLAETAVTDELAGLHFRVIDEFLGLIEEIAVRRPVAIVVDDLHWADSATLAALRSVAKRLTFVGVAIIATARPVPTTRELERLMAVWQEEGALVLRLDALDREHVVRLVNSALEAEPDDALLGFVGGASGNPLFIGELLGALERDAGITVAGGRATLKGPSRPPGLSLVILGRLTFLSEDALGALRCASLLGSSFSPGDLATVAATPLPALVASIDECVRARLLEAHDDLLRFRHDLIREALYYDIPEGVRAGLHVEAARALAARDAPLVLVAQQYVLGARSGDREAIEAIRRAALEGEPSPAARIELLERALSLAAKDDPVWAEIETDLAETLVWGGRPAEGESRSRNLLARVTNPMLALRMRAAAAQGLRLGGRWVELAELVDGWLGDPNVEGRERVELLTANAYARGSSVAFDAHEAERIGKEALELAERTGDDELIAHALVCLLPAMSRLARPETRALAERAVWIAEAHPEDRFLRDQPHWHLGHLLGDPDEAEGVFRAGLQLAEDRGRVSDVPLFLDGLAHVLFYRRAWDDAVAEAEAAIAAAEEVGTLLHVTGSLALRAHVSIQRGDLVAAEKHIEAEERIAKRLGPQMEVASLSHRSMVHEMRGDFARALDVRWEGFQLEAAHSDEVNWWRCLWCALQAGDGFRAEAVTVWLEERAERVGTDKARAEASLARSLLDRDPTRVRASLDALGGISGPLQLAAGWETSQWARERAALACAHVGLTDDALNHYGAIVPVYEQVGAHAWLDQVARQLQHLGVAVPRRRRRARAVRGWEALTDAERRVAELAAEGLTNPQIGERLFISRRTVQTHLGHVFAKLDISSRVELAAEVARRTVS